MYRDPELYIGDKLIDLAWHYFDEESWLREYCKTSAVRRREFNSAESQNIKLGRSAKHNGGLPNNKYEIAEKRFANTNKFLHVEFGKIQLKEGCYRIPKRACNL